MKLPYEACLCIFILHKGKCKFRKVGPLPQVSQLKIYRIIFSTQVSDSKDVLPPFHCTHTLPASVNDTCPSPQDGQLPPYGTDCCV